MMRVRGLKTIDMIELGASERNLSFIIEIFELKIGQERNFIYS